jgi:4a-hydroxytetrahydrobiopterin dehydratase
LLLQLDSWQLSADGKAIYKKRSLKHFVEALEFINGVGDLAEEEQHHPDLHLTGYRNVRIELTTHAIGGLSENDFIVAAKIDALTV